jgi:O-antigen ligase
MAPIKEGKALSGLGFNEKVRSHCNGNDISYMRTMGHGKGLPHAHNIIGQIMGETGIPGLTALVGVIGLITSSIKSKLIEKQNEGSDNRNDHKLLHLPDD